MSRYLLILLLTAMYGCLANANQQLDEQETGPSISREDSEVLRRDLENFKKQLQEYAALPRKGFVSPKTKDHRFARYGQEFWEKVVNVGDLNFPHTKEGKALYGDVQVMVEVLPDGSVSKTEITRSSKDSRIDNAVLNIIKKAAPFSSFSPELKKDYDVLVLIRTLKFTRKMEQ